MTNALDEADRLFEEGEGYADDGNDQEALKKYGEAWNALPEPKGDQDPAVPILGAIADACFRLRNWDDCRNAVQHSFRCGADMSNPFLRLRLGQSLFELGDIAEAGNWFVPAYLSEGLSLFENEDPKYLASFRGKLDPPPGGWPEGW